MEHQAPKQLAEMHIALQEKHIATLDKLVAALWEVKRLTEKLRDYEDAVK